MMHKKKSLGITEKTKTKTKHERYRHEMMQINQSSSLTC